MSNIWDRILQVLNSFLFECPTEFRASRASIEEDLHVFYKVFKITPPALLEEDL